MTDPSPSAAPRPTGRGLKILLAVSLAINLAVVGTVAGMALRGDDEGRRGPPPVRDLSFGPFSEALTRDQRRAMLQDFARNGPDLRQMRAQMRGELDAVLATLRATPFDPAAFRMAVETQTSRIAARAEGGRDALVALVLQMSETERAAFVERLEKSLSRRDKREDRQPGPPG